MSIHPAIIGPIFTGIGFAMTLIAFYGTRAKPQKYVAIVCGIVFLSSVVLYILTLANYNASL